MAYKREGEKVVLEMTGEEYDLLLMMLGYAIGSARHKGLFYRWLRLVNDLNAGNPAYTPYEIPEEGAAGA